MGQIWSFLKVLKSLIHLTNKKNIEFEKKKVNKEKTEECQKFVVITTVHILYIYNSLYAMIYFHLL